MKSEFNSRVLYLTLFVLVVTSCGGGGSGSGAEADDASLGGQSRFTGFIYYGSAGYLKKYDMTTSEISDVFDSIGMDDMRVSDDSSTFVWRNAYGDEYEVRDASGNQVYARSTGGKYDGMLNISPNNQYFLYNWKRMAGDYALRIDDINGIRSKTYSASGYDWVNDDEIVFANGDYIYRLKGLGLEGGTIGEPEAIINFPNGISSL